MPFANATILRLPPRRFECDTCTTARASVAAAIRWIFNSPGTLYFQTAQVYSVTGRGLDQDPSRCVAAQD